MLVYNTLRLPGFWTLSIVYRPEQNTEYRDWYQLLFSGEKVAWTVRRTNSKFLDNLCQLTISIFMHTVSVFVSKRQSLALQISFCLVRLFAACLGISRKSVRCFTASVPNVPSSKGSVFHYCGGGPVKKFKLTTKTSAYLQDDMPARQFSQNLLSIFEGKLPVYIFDCLIKLKKTHFVVFQKPQRS
jgi:hypothetical protein